MSTGRTYFRYKYFQLKEQLRIIRRHYKKARFAVADLVLLGFYLFINPFRISKRYLQRKGAADVHAYGETPPTAFAAIAKASLLCENDYVLEVGSGRGRLGLWLAATVGCRYEGIEQIALFNRLARLAARAAGLKKVAFRTGDALLADFSKYSFIYVYGSNYSDDEIVALEAAVRRAKSGCLIVTISYPLSLYNSIELVSTQALDFPWGKAIAYMHLKK